MTRLSPSQLDTLALEYACGAMDEADRIRMNALMADDPVLASRVAHWREHLFDLDATARPVQPSPDLWPRLLVSLGQPQPQETQRVTRVKPVPGGLRGFWHNLAFWRFTTIASKLVIASMIVAFLMAWPAQPEFVAVLQDDRGAPVAVVESFKDGRVRLIPLKRLDVPEGRALEIWTKRNDEEGPISVGLIDEARTVKLDLRDLPAPIADQLFEITLEPVTGSPTGKPTGPILGKGLTKDAL